MAIGTLLSGCDERTTNAMWAKIQAIEVDAREAQGAEPVEGKLSKQDVDLAVNTARDLTVNDGGLFSQSPKRELEIDVVDPLKVPRPDGEPLDARVQGVVFDVADLARQAAHDLPDVPVAAPREAERANVTVEAPEVAEEVHRIQVGSFGTLLAAQEAWKDLRDSYPAAGKLKPTYEKVVANNGRTLVRLKVGPVRDEAQARRLCDALEVRDNWCARAG